MWKNRVLYIIILFAALISYIMADRRESLIFLCVLLIIPFMMLIIQFRAMRSASIRCKAKETCRMGSSIPIIFTLEKNNKMPLGIIHVNVVFENLMFAEKKVVELNLQPGEEKLMTFEYPFSANDCGALKISVSNIDYYDLMGLFKWKGIITEKKEIRVYPPELHLNTELSRRPETKSFGELYDQYKKGQDVSEVADLRDYVEGDSMSGIHWKLSGKLDKMIVREFGSPSNYNTLIIYEMMKKSGDVLISNSQNNGVLAITTALSYSMMEMGLEHNVGRIYAQELQTVPVNSFGTHEQMAENLLYTTILEEDGSNFAFVFLRGNYRNEYTKIIYITPNYDEASLKQIANEADLTVIHVVEGKDLEYVDRNGYTIIPVNVDTYQNRIHNIVL